MGCLKLNYNYDTDLKISWVNNYVRSEKTTLKIHSNYVYGFNGQEKDDEVKGSGNSLDFGARIYDSRLGRWLSVDPLTKKYPSISGYQYAGNRPVSSIDFGGLEEDPAADNWASLPPKPQTTRAFRIYASISISMGAQLGISAGAIAEVQASASAGGVSGEIGVFIDIYEDGRTDFGLAVTNTDQQYSHSLSAGPYGMSESSSRVKTTTISFQQGVNIAKENENTTKTSGSFGPFGSSEVNGQLESVRFGSISAGVMAIIGVGAEVSAFSYYAPGAPVSDPPPPPPPPRTLTQPVDNTKPNQGPTTTNAPAPAAPATPTETSPNNGGQLNSVPLFQIEVQQPDALRTNVLRPQ